MKLLKCISPPRLQLSRRKGYRKPAGAVVVSRPSKYGNRFRASEFGGSKAKAVAAYAHWVKTTPEGRQLIEAARRELRGKPLCCWCGLGESCHADFWIEMANAEMAKLTKESV